MLRSQAQAKQALKKIYAIEGAFKSAKVYSFKLNIKNIIDEIIVNFRHEVKEDVVEIGTITTHSDFHIERLESPLDNLLGWSYLGRQ